MNLNDLRVDSWRQICLAIERGERPTDSNIYSAFMRGEVLTRQQQLSIAKLFAASPLRKRGRPKNKKIDRLLTKQRQEMNDYCFYLWVTEEASQLQKKGFANPVDAAIKSAGRGSPETRWRQYQRGKKFAVVPE